MPKQATNWATKKTEVKEIKSQEGVLKLTKKGDMRIIKDGKRA